MLVSSKIEKTCLAGLLLNPNIYFEIEHVISANDFCSPSAKVHRSIFNCISQICRSQETLEPTLLSERVRELGISFDDKNLSVDDYIWGLSQRTLSEKETLQAFKELGKLSVKRGIYKTVQKIASEMESAPLSWSHTDIINTADEIYNKQIDSFVVDSNNTENIFEIMEETVEARADNPLDELGPMGPFPRVNEMYGSLLRAGNISVIVARTGVGKTSLALFYTVWVAKHYNLPIIHFDNGEMSKREILERLCCQMAKVPVSEIERGTWRRNRLYTERVRALWSEIKDIKFYYENVGGMSVEEIKSKFRRVYLSKVGRGKHCIWSFDYLKHMHGASGEKDFWAEIGQLVNVSKTMIQRELLDEQGEPTVAMFTSGQANRKGIVSGRGASDVNDSEDVVGLSDMIMQYCSHMFLLRQKTIEERAGEADNFGTHKLVHFKSRHMGQEAGRAFELVEMPDGRMVKNYVNLDFKDFNFEERGDAIDMVRQMQVEGISPVSSRVEEVEL